MAVIDRGADLAARAEAMIAELREEADQLEASVIAWRRARQLVEEEEAAGEAPM